MQQVSGSDLVIRAVIFQRGPHLRGGGRPGNNHFRPCLNPLASLPSQLSGPGGAVHVSASPAVPSPRPLALLESVLRAVLPRRNLVVMNLGSEVTENHAKRERIFVGPGKVRLPARCLDAPLASLALT